MHGERQFYLLTQSLRFIYININCQGSSHHSQSRKKHVVSIQGGGVVIQPPRFAKIKDVLLSLVVKCTKHYMLFLFISLLTYRTTPKVSVNGLFLTIFKYSVGTA